MGSRKPLILITNDDGFQAKGIASLTEAMKGLGEIVVFGYVVCHIPLAASPGTDDTPRGGSDGICV
jgi:hypothetical protein